MTIDFDSLDAAVELALRNHTCARLMPGELAELARLARVGAWAESVADTGLKLATCEFARPLHEDNRA